MTREEAIKIIADYDVNGCGYCHQGGDEIPEAFNTAIEALKAEPCEVTWVTNNKGEGVAFKDMPIEKVNKILAIMDDEPCEDTVNRKHLLSGIDELMQSPWFNNGKDDDTFKHYGYVERKEAVEIVRDLCVKTEPSVTSKQKTGKWIMRSKAWKEYYVCSVCGYGENDELTQRTKFCPNCGAKMER